MLDAEGARALKTELGARTMAVASTGAMIYLPTADLKFAAGSTPAHPRLSNLSLSEERSMPTGGGSGRGAMRAISTMLNCLFAVTWNGGAEASV